MKEKNNEIMEKKLQKNKRSKIIVQQLYVHPQNCSISITIVTFCIFSKLPIFNIKKLVGKIGFKKYLEPL
jgi:hypothetical protein